MDLQASKPMCFECFFKNISGEFFRPTKAVFYEYFQKDLPT